MDGTEVDREEVDLLVLELTTDKPIRRKAAPFAPKQPAAPQPVAPQPPEPRPVSRWSDVRLLMPEARPTAAVSGKRSAFASAIPFPQIHLPDFSRVLRMPGPVMLTRMWVGLGAVYGAAMIFWPYPKTYLWGLVLYLLSLGLVLTTGVWGAKLSWDSRLGTSHTVALCTVLLAIALAAGEIVPLMQ
jgi:hypothetical protein